MASSTRWFFTPSSKLGVGSFCSCDGSSEVVHGMREGVLVADDVARGPPRAGVGCLPSVTRMVAEAASCGALLDVELELVHALEIEHEAALGCR